MTGTSLRARHISCARWASACVNQKTYVLALILPEQLKRSARTSPSTNRATKSSGEETAHLPNTYAVGQWERWRFSRLVLRLSRRLRSTSLELRRCRVFVTKAKFNPDRKF